MGMVVILFFDLKEGGLYIYNGARVKRMVR